MNRAQNNQSAPKAIPYQELVRMTPTLLTPLAALAVLMAVWRFGTDIGWTDNFVVTDGLLSHWQVWLSLAVGIQWLAVRLERKLKQR